MDLMKFLSDQTLVIVAALWVLGMIIKGVPKLPNWKIPMFLLLLGILLSFGIFFFKEITTVIVQGIIATGAAVFVHGAIKHKIKYKLKSADTVKSVEDNVADYKNQ